MSAPPARGQRTSGLRRRPGYLWRWLAHRDAAGEPAAGGPVSGRYEPSDGVCFDELVVDNWLHIEQMDDRHWWMDIAGITVRVWIKSNDVPEVLIEQDDPDRANLRNYL